jgi:hypothetical protein
MLYHDWSSAIYHVDVIFQQLVAPLYRVFQ